MGLFKAIVSSVNQGIDNYKKENPDKGSSKLINGISNVADAAYNFSPKTIVETSYKGATLLGHGAGKIINAVAHSSIAGTFSTVRNKWDEAVKAADQKEELMKMVEENKEVLLDLFSFVPNKEAIQEATVVGKK